MVVHVIIGIILNKNNDILIAQRLSHQEKAGYWEFPGGKVEKNESAFNALQRELKEELNIEVITANAWMQTEHHYSHQSVLLDTWLVTEFAGDPVGAEGQPIRWISSYQLSEFQFPEGNRDIVEKLQAHLK